MDARGKKYGILSVLKRMIKTAAQEDKALSVMVFFYTAAAGVYPFFGVFLPKIAIGILERKGDGAAVKLAAAMGIYALVAGGVGWLMVYFNSTIRMRMMRLRVGYVNAELHKLLEMDYKYTEDARFFEENDKALSAGRSDDMGIEAVYGELYKLPARFIGIIGMFLLVGYLHPLILLCLVAHVLVTMWVARVNYRNDYAHKEEIAKASRRTEYYHKTTHDFSYGKDIRIYHLKERIMQNYEAEMNALRLIWQKLENRKYVLGFISLFTLFITNGVMYGILIDKAYQGMPISSFSMYIAAVNSLLSALLDFGKSLTTIFDEGQYAADYFKLVDRNLRTEGKGGGRIAASETLEIVFEHVSFRYPNMEKNIFTDLNLRIRKGERLAIVGINGAGKSTLVKLMTGLYAPTEGRIFINGTEIRQFKKQELFGLFSVVFQEVNIFPFTIRENVACRSENIEDDKVRTALDKAGLRQKVESLENGLEQMMLKVIDENGTDFSGGERQKLAIARGLYKDANMVIMDEPTAALDALAEAEIYENFNALVEGKTAVYISHRLASTKFCDKIALFDKDGLTEYGSHEELMRLKRKYYEMFTIQGKYYQDCT
ncbi:MAG: ABC transporter ATP-binding protein/permease [Clostridium sp.]|nr:ABC transporter ATP-binding protein/permease [Clostridium sp.]